MIDLIFDKLSDPVARENFEKLDQHLRDQIFSKLEGKHFEIVISGAVTNQRFKHNLGFVPKDIVQTSVKGAGTISWNYDNFDKDYVYFTTTNACTVRVFIGTYAER